MEKILKKIDRIFQIFSYPEDKKLQEEYVSLFINNFEGIKCSLYGYDYFKNVLPQTFFLNLKKLYKSAGLEISPDYNEREDHLLTLLEFLEYLIKINVPETYLKKFAENYLFWLPQLAEKIKNETNEELYLQGAKLLEELYENLQNN